MFYTEETPLLFLQARCNDINRIINNTKYIDKDTIKNDIQRILNILSTMSTGFDQKIRKRQRVRNGRGSMTVIECLISNYIRSFISVCKELEELGFIEYIEVRNIMEGILTKINNKGKSVGQKSVARQILDEGISKLPISNDPSHFQTKQISEDEVY